MRKHMVENAAFEIATQIRAVEDCIDSALAEMAELQARMMRIQSVAAVSYGVIHPSLRQVSAALNGLIESRGAIVACHGELVEAQGKVPGLRTVSYGDEGACPKTAQADLRIVA